MAHMHVKASSQSGLTLIELLVSIVILGFVVTIMSGAFFQVSKIVRVGESANGQFQPKWLRINVLPEVVANMVLPENVEKPFIGDGNEFTGFSLSLPQSDWGLARKFTVRLVPQTRGDGFDMTIAEPDGKPMVITSWGTRVRFEYLDAEGNAQSMWPPFGKNQDAMPIAVMVRSISGEQMLQMIAPYAGMRKVEPDAKKGMEALFGVGKQ
ncbi:MAG: prepilin-type N-terminal cleavage/methylation domain-containing protein [Burkholderiales bacterium]|nr:prepilin-type N-terminal cleavage/methylation domain-containing protein [Burkholderiales bacterium]